MAQLLKDMKKLDLWSYIGTDADAAYLQEIKSAGAEVELDSTLEMSPMANIGDFSAETLQWIMDNKSTCEEHFFEDDHWHSNEYSKQQRLPGSVGFNRGNTLEYLWGGNAKNSDALKELYGRDLFTTAGVDYDSTECKLLVYMPGNVCCLHLDMYQNWSDKNTHLNPRITHHPELESMVAEDRENRWKVADQNTCDKGRIVRRNVMISEWHWGHVIQVENASLPRWKAGDVFDIPACIYHLSANVGVKLKMTLILTGAELNDRR
jgi:hypothetical protein